MRNKGFTLIELLVAIGILAILGAVGLVTFSNAQTVGRDGKRKEDIEQLRQSLLLYKEHQRVANLPSLYPDNLSDLSPDYINTTPKDPSTKADYDYTPVMTGSDNTSYNLCAILENPNLADTISGCPNGNDNYEVHPPS